MTYTFVDFEQQDAYGDTFDYDTIEECLYRLIKECDFLVTNYGTMYPTEGITIWPGHRGPTVQTKHSSGFDWYYRITGGYKKDK